MNNVICVNYKQGCLACFSIKKEYIQPDAIIISFYYMIHMRLDESVAHGINDGTSNSQASQLAPRIS